MGKRVLFCLFFWLSVSFIPLSAKAESPNTFEFSFFADKKMITLGEELTLNLHFLVSDQFEIEPVKDTGQFQPLEVNSITVTTTEPVKSIRSESYTIKLTTFQFGEFEIKAFPIKFRVKNSEDRTVFTNPVSVRCISVVGSDSELNEMKPIKGQESVDKKPMPTWLLLLIAGGGLVLLFSMIKGVRRFIANWRERQLTPYERAIRKLEHLSTSGAENSESVYQFYVELSAAFREALIYGCGVGASNMTTTEWEKLLNSDARLSRRHSDISKILRSSDMAKFAGAYFNPESSRETARLASSLCAELFNELNAKSDEKKK